MTELATAVPPTWKESAEQESTKVELDTLRNDARRQQTELQETVSFHKQYREAVTKAGDCLRDIEERMEDAPSVNNDSQNGPSFEVSMILSFISRADNKGYITFW